MPNPFTSPVGRIVQGDAFKATQRQDQNGKGRVDAQGQPEMQYFVALAIPKTDPEWAHQKAELQQMDRASWPTMFDAAGNCLRADFATKIIDGDSVIMDKKNVRPCDREGWAGCDVIKFASKFAPKVYKAINGAWVEVATGVKCGDFARISYSTVTNQSTQTPGMYRNLEMIQFDHEGPAIISGPTAEQRFGAAPGAGGPGNAAPAASPPPPAATTPASPIASPASPPPPPPPPSDSFMHVLTAKANGASYESFIANGWTDETLRQHGYMA